MFFVDFRCEITEKGLKWTKKVENGWKKYFDQILGARSTLKLVEIQNIPSLFLIKYLRSQSQMLFSLHYLVRHTLC